MSIQRASKSHNSGVIASAILVLVAATACSSHSDTGSDQLALASMRQLSESFGVLKLGNDARCTAIFMGTQPGSAARGNTAYAITSAHCLYQQKLNTSESASITWYSGREPSHIAQVGMSENQTSLVGDFALLELGRTPQGVEAFSLTGRSALEEAEQALESTEERDLTATRKASGFESVTSVTTGQRVRIYGLKAEGSSLVPKRYFCKVVAANTSQPTADGFEIGQCRPSLSSATSPGLSGSLVVTAMGIAGVFKGAMPNRDSFLVSALPRGGKITNLGLAFSDKTLDPKDLPSAMCMRSFAAKCAMNTMESVRSCARIWAEEQSVEGSSNPNGTTCGLDPNSTNFDERIRWLLVEDNASFGTRGK